MIDLELLRASRTFRIVFPIVVLLAFLWLSRNNAMRDPTPPRVSLAELERATQHLPFVTLLGRDGPHYRFQTPDGRAFLVARSEVQPALDAALPSVDAGIGLFVKIEAGKVTVPDPRVMAEWYERHGPSPDGAVGAASQRKRTLPVVRHTNEDEPTLLVLTSDGDWTDDDLTRLDAVLKDWANTQCPGRADDEPLPESERPRLWYDQAQSGQDRKTIVILARNFCDEWCEPLARRLGVEYPFLWQMDVGAKPGPLRPRAVPAPSPPRSEPRAGDQREDSRSP